MTSSQEMSSQISVAIDAMGSDLGSTVIVDAVVNLAQSDNCPKLLVVGEQELLHTLLRQKTFRKDRIQIVHASTHIGQDEKPKVAIAEKLDASIHVAARLVASGQAQVLVSAGNTGAVTLACATHFGRLPNVERTALSAVYPTERRRGADQDPFSLILDVGLTLDPSARDLVNFALMGSAYARKVSKNPRPKVGLLSNGSEAGKGTPAIAEAHALLRELKNIDFIGNIEGNDIPKGTADVVVTGGFVGNIVLKMLEGVSETMVRTMQYAGERNLRYRAAIGVLSPLIKRIRQATDWQEYGGVPILGFDRLCIKAHGRSTERAIANAIKVATKAARTGVVDAIRQDLLESQAVPGNKTPVER